MWDAHSLRRGNGGARGGANTENIPEKVGCLLQGLATKEVSPSSSAWACQARVGSGANLAQEKPEREPQTGVQGRSIRPACSGGSWRSAEGLSPGLRPSLQRRPSQDCPYRFWLCEPLLLWAFLWGSESGPFCMSPENAGLWALLWPRKET